MLEFTGERMVPGLAADPLFNEHFARYRFAAGVVSQLGEHPEVLDAGCGAGYGAAQFPARARVTGIDISWEAIAYSRVNFAKPDIRFLQAACESLPFMDNAFDMIAAFEVIEHLVRWREMLCETRRCLKPSGVMLVSTPNKAYYAESRAKVGPNPFHVHEFGYEEFSAALEEFFPHVRLWTQNRTEAIAFVPVERNGSGTLESPADREPANAHFFLAACSRRPLVFAEPFAWLPATGNMLRERERHIALLEGDLAQLRENHAALNRSHKAVIAELEERNAWAARLNQEIEECGARIAALQNEIESIHAGYGQHLARLKTEIGSVHEGYGRQIADLRKEDASRLQWIADLEAQIRRGQAEIERLNRVRDSLEAEKTAILASKWFRLGSRLNLGPASPGQ